jgi:serine/threonine protein kinase
MEDIDVPSLAQYPPSTLTITDTTRILCDMSSALYYMHRSGFAHNDIKPGNILFSPARGAVLIDFGLSTELAERGVLTGGTPWYVPPEFMQGGQRGTPGDVFALGVVMLYVLNKFPLPELHGLRWRIAEALNPTSEAAGTMQLWQDVVQQTAEHLDVASSALELLVKAMVARDLATRISLDSLAEELSALRRDG